MTPIGDSSRFLARVPTAYLESFRINRDLPSFSGELFRLRRFCFEMKVLNELFGALYCSIHEMTSVLFSFLILLY